MVGLATIPRLIQDIGLSPILRLAHWYDLPGVLWRMISVLFIGTWMPAKFLLRVSFRQFLCYFPGAFFASKKASNPTRNLVIIEGDIKRPRNNNPYENRRFAETTLFPSRTFGKIPPRNMAGGEFKAGAFFLTLLSPYSSRRQCNISCYYRVLRNGFHYGWAHSQPRWHYRVRLMCPLNQI